LEYPKEIKDKFHEKIRPSQKTIKTQGEPHKSLTKNEELEIKNTTNVKEESTVESSNILEEINDTASEVKSDTLIENLEKNLVLDENTEKISNMMDQIQSKFGDLGSNTSDFRAENREIEENPEKFSSMMNQIQSKFGDLESKLTRLTTENETITKSLELPKQQLLEQKDSIKYSISKPVNLTPPPNIKRQIPPSLTNTINESVSPPLVIEEIKKPSSTGRRLPKATAPSFDKPIRSDSDFEFNNQTPVRVENPDLEQYTSIFASHDGNSDYSSQSNEHYQPLDPTPPSINPSLDIDVYPSNELQELGSNESNSVPVSVDEEYMKDMQQQMDQMFGSSAEGISLNQQPIAPDIIIQCQKLDLDPRMGIGKIDEKAQEVMYQIGNLTNLSDMLADAYFNNKIDDDQYNKQDSSLKLYLNKLENILELLKILRESYSSSF
jgi:hypothetical protein